MYMYRKYEVRFEPLLYRVAMCHLHGRQGPSMFHNGHYAKVWYGVLEHARSMHCDHSFQLQRHLRAPLQ